MPKSSKISGFTLIEMLVVAPLIVIVIATIVGFMVSLVGSIVVSTARTQVQYNTQDALNQIEQDTFLSTSFLNSYTPPSPQGRDDATGQFLASSNDIILEQPGISNNPADNIRQVVHYANRPNACADTNFRVNDLFYIKVVYFVKDTTLYRRTIVPDWNTNLNNANTVCSNVWQRDSCSVINGSTCLTRDAALISNVSNISLTTSYYKKALPNTPIVGDISDADSIKVTIAITTTAAGESFTSTNELAATRSIN